MPDKIIALKMAASNLPVYSGKIAFQLLSDVVYFPLWWYSRGLVLLSAGLKDFIVNREKGLALLVWIRNLHRPMYGQRDIAGVLISFFMRLIQIFARGLAMAAWIALALLFLLFWLVLPLIIAYELVFQLWPV